MRRTGDGRRTLGALLLAFKQAQLLDRQLAALAGGSPDVVQLLRGALADGLFLSALRGAGGGGFDDGDEFCADG